MTIGTILCLLSLAALRAGEAEKRPLVKTKYGMLQGKTVPVKGTLRTVDAFLGIPFAKPPVGPLRFAKPEPPEPWKSVRDASQNPSMCLQLSTGNVDGMLLYQSSFKIPPMSENCLYLNVYTPSDRQKGLNCPVMFFIHGGGLLFWAASYFDGSALTAYEDVVVVCVQYRLGMMGFLSTGDDQLPGNYGLLDQVAALHWVKENIASFGGDPNYVTIFGESAGAISVAAHVLSPLSKGLFHRAIAESGTMNFPGVVISNTEDFIFYRDMVSKLFDCDPNSLKQCLMRKSEKEILAVMNELQIFPFLLSVDGVFLRKPVEEIVANNESNAVPFLLGVNYQEAGWFMLKYFLNISGLTEGMSRQYIQQTLQDIVLLRLKADVIPRVLEEYLGGVTDPFLLRDGFVDIVGDRIFDMPALRTAKSHRDSGHPVYFYRFQHNSSWLANKRPAYVRADHTDDLFYVFGGHFLRNGALLSINATDEEELLSRKMMRYWTNFARNGDPNGAGLADWPLYDAEEPYLEIDTTQNVAFRLKEDKFKFWSELSPEQNREATTLSSSSALSLFPSLALILILNLFFF